MNLRKTLVGGAALCAICLLVVVVRSGPATQIEKKVAPGYASKTCATNGRPTTPASIGRFKLELGAPGVGTFMYDTTNGECWHWDGEAWEAMGIPKSAAAR